MNYESSLLDIFKEVKARDIEIASATLDLWDDIADAAKFLSTPAKTLEEQMPLAFIEGGRREDILTLIIKAKRSGITS